MLRPRVGGEVQTLWTDTLSHYTSYQEVELVEIAMQLRALHQSFEDHDSHKNMIKKYEKPFYHRAAQIFSLRVEDVCFSTAAARGEFERWRAQEKRSAKEREERERQEKVERADRDAAERDRERRAQAALREASLGRGQMGSWGHDGHKESASIGLHPNLNHNPNHNLNPNPNPLLSRFSSAGSLCSLPSTTNLVTLSAGSVMQQQQPGAASVLERPQAQSLVAPPPSQPPAPAPAPGPPLPAEAAPSRSLGLSTSMPGGLYRLATGRGPGLGPSSGSRSAAQLSAAAATVTASGQRRTNYTSAMAGLQSLHSSNSNSNPGGAGIAFGRARGDGQVQVQGQGNGQGGVLMLANRQLTSTKRTKTLP